MRLEKGFLGFLAASAGLNDLKQPTTETNSEANILKRATPGSSLIGRPLDVAKYSPTITDFGYVDCNTTASKYGLPVDPTGIDCYFGEGRNKSHVTSNTPVIRSVAENFLNTGVLDTTKITPNASWNSLVFSFNPDDPNRNIKGADLYVHPVLEDAAINNNGSKAQRVEKVIKPIIEGVTGQNITSEDTLSLYENARKCGLHADNGDQSGANYAIKIGDFRATVKEGGLAEIDTTKLSPDEIKIVNIVNGTINGDCYISITKPEEPNDNPTGKVWIGEKVSDIVNSSPIIDKLNYTACTSTAVEVSPQIRKKDQRVCSYSEEDGEVTLIPGPDFFEDLANTTKEYWTLIQEKDKVDNRYSLSPMTISYDEKQRITKTTLKWPAMVLAFRKAHGGNGTESTDILLPWLKEVTGIQDIKPEDTKDLANAARRCGSHAEDDKNGNKFTKKFGKFTATIGGGDSESKPRKHERSFRKDLEGDCGITVFIANEENDAKENSSASTWSKSSNAKKWATAATIAASLRFLI